MSSFDEKLHALRDQIDDIDSQLVDLLAKRRAVTTQVGELKSQVGMPIYAPDREAQLLLKRRNQAINAGISADLIEDILRRLMRDSYVSQDASGYQCINPSCKKVVVVGGNGQLGGIFVDLFQRSGYLVEIIGHEDWPNAEQILAGAGAVIVAVPIRLTNDIIAKLNGLAEDCILADVTSVKVSPLKQMLAIHKGPVVGLHPMFGPDVAGLIKQTIITCEGRMAEQYQWLLRQFQVWGAKIYPVDAQSHDQAMAMVQVMRHFSTIAYGYHLMEEGADIAQLVDMSSPIYRLELSMVGRLFAQDPILYSDIIFAEPDNIEMMKRFAHRFLTLLEGVEAGDKNGFVQMFNQVSDWFGDYADIFLQESKLMLVKANEVKKD
ncbi:bifunctional chorismate mutase/prephenate dehydrogenase [Thalassotalea sp. PLHSN55]|uniref:bifunctional chorismate mutase/prephenate dehydrogenase n=1 Tax=Thalassotalea sp. PLHSN55 TaxID=3435888 RepID=UPI003F856C4E